MTVTSIGLIISFLTMTAVAAKLLLENKKLKSRLSVENELLELKGDVRRLLWNITFQREKVKDSVTKLVNKTITMYSEKQTAEIINKVMDKIK